MTLETAIRPGALYRLAWYLYLVLAVGGAIWIGWREGTIPLALFLDPDGWWIDLGAGAAAGAALLGCWELARRTLRQARMLEDHFAELLGRLERTEALALALLSGFAEELFFRGAMQAAWGWIIATVVFTLLHTGPGATYRVWTAFSLVAGLVLAGLMEWRGNLLAPVSAHFLVNAVNLGRICGGERGERGERDGDAGAEA